MVEHFLQEAIVILGAAVVVVVVCARARIPAIVGLLLTGLLLGPSGFRLVEDLERVELFAEIGVVLLLFAIGLELSLERLRELRRPFLIGGSLQTGLTMAAAAVIGAVALGLPIAESLFLGFVAALSSTAVVLKLYAERRETETPQGQVVLGILLFQDFLIVPLIVLTPVLAGEVAAAPLELFSRFGLSLLAVAAISVAALRLLPWMLERLVRTGVREVFVLGALGICLSMSWLTAKMGFSPALGAFLAGILVSESEYSHQVIADVVPFRDVFASLFFVSVGMLVDLDFLFASWLPIVALAAGLVLLKTLAAAVATLVLAYPVRIALIVGLGLAQIGEFSFVLLEVGREHGLIDTERFQTLLSAAVLSLFLTPLLVRVAPALGRRLADKLGGEAPEVEAAPSWLRDHVVIIGLGLGGSLLARVVEAAHIRCVGIELSGDAARRARREGHRVIYGDATRREVLEAAGVPEARVVVFAISDAQALAGSVHLARQLAPHAELLVRTHKARQVDALHRAGADDVVVEELEAALSLFTRVLEGYHVARNIIRAQVRALRAEGYGMLRAPRPGRAVSEAVLDALAAGTTDLYRVETGSGVAGRSLRSLELRQRTGATVIAVVRGDVSHPNPSPDLALEAGDTLVLVGSHAEIDSAFALLDDVARGVEDAAAAATSAEGGEPVAER